MLSLDISSVAIELSDFTISKLISDSVLYLIFTSLLIGLVIEQISLPSILQRVYSGISYLPNASKYCIIYAPNTLEKLYVNKSSENSPEILISFSPGNSLSQFLLKLPSL